MRYLKHGIAKNIEKESINTSVADARAMVIISGRYT